MLAQSPAARDSAAVPGRPRRYTSRVDREDWDRRYLETELVWSAEPNRFLVEEVAGLLDGLEIEEAGTRRRLVETGQGAVYEIDCLVRARASGWDSDCAHTGAP